MENYGILLVEDEPAYHAILSALLGTDASAIDLAGDGRAALDAVRARRYGLVLIDVRMPDMDGFAIASAIRSEVPWGAAVPIIAFTALSPADGERHFLERGFDGWLAKPLRASAFRAMLNSWLGRDLVGEAAETPEERLGALLGGQAASAMIGRFHGSLAEAVAAIERGDDPKPLGHRIGGLAGTLGFAALSAAWLALQDDEAVWPTVRALTLEALSARGTARIDGAI
jgi:CheY-like chemotaxis protein